MRQALDIARQFRVEGTPVEAKPFGGGHINDTYCVRCEREGLPVRRYVLQRINDKVFRDVPALMENMVAVTAYLRQAVIREGGDPDRECLNLVPTTDGGFCYKDEEGGSWLTTMFIEKAVTYQTVGDPKLFYYAGRAFGRFQRQLTGYPSASLHETIPHFHDTVSRYGDFEHAVAQNASGRAGQVAEEIAFVRARKADTAVVVDMLAKGELPLRVTHNDTKLDNVMLDEVTGEPVCVIDLNTVMPGSSLYDFGDSIRFGASTAAEDEQDLDKVHFDIGLFRAFTRGFLQECGDMLTENELRLLPFAAKLITLECGMRFLTDHIAGDVYFKIHREGHNLDRCRTQFKLVAEMEQQMDAMAAVVNEVMSGIAR